MDQPRGTRPTHAAYLAARSFGALDGVRGLSILAVVYHHAHGALAWGRTSERGFLGVDLFFVLSGFLIVTLLLRERDQTGRVSLRNFAARRALRIMPLYFGILLLDTVILGVLRRDGSHAGAFWKELPYLLTYTTNWVPVTTLSVTWSLSAEEQFYLVWPLIEKVVRRPALLAVALIVASEAVALGLLDRPLSSWFGWTAREPAMLRQTTFAPILLGVLLAHVLHDQRGFAVVVRALGSPLSPILILGALLGVVPLLPADLSGWPRLCVHLLMILLLASVVVREDHALHGFLSWGPLRRLGVLSYGMYLWHMFALAVPLGMVNAGRLSALLLFPLTLALTVALAEVSLRHYETPFLRLRARFRASRDLTLRSTPQRARLAAAQGSSS
jgi:peptidoglycan/LPS O-acetylase OafA/YrhL